MKNVLILLVLLLLAAACSTDDKKENIEKSDEESSIVKGDNEEAVEINSDESAASIDAPKVNQVLYKFEAGDELKYRMTSYSTQEQYLETDTAMSSSAKQTVKYVFDMKVLDVSESGETDISLTINSIELDGNYNGTAVYYNSLDEMTDEERKEFADYETIANSQFQVQINSAGKIISLSNVEDILEKMMSLRGVEKELTAEEKENTKNELSDAALRPLAQQLFRLMPADTVNIDDTWKHNYVSQLSVFQIVNITEYKVDKFFNDDANLKADISAKLNVVVEGDRSFTQQGVEYNFDEPVITGKGNVVFNIDRGIMERSETTTTVRIDMTVKALDSSNLMQTAKRSDNSINTNIVELL
jgi:uncharacterized protein YxeA